MFFISWMSDVVSLAALKPLQPRYVKNIAGEDSLMAAIVGRAMGHGNS
jgi:hypothetical protein